MYKKYYQLFLNANKHLQHYAAHSHHYWPDVTRAATIQYWDDSASKVDAKWNYFFSEKIPQTQKLIAEILNLSYPEQITFAPNTHEFIFRILSCFNVKKPLRILTTDSEFYSFERQINRLAEDHLVSVEKIATEPFATFESRFTEAIQNNHYDLIFMSHVFYNSGFAVQNLNQLVQAVRSPETIIVIDGYHGFMAIPTDLAPIQDRIFYLSGSYKYAQGGEGCCFLTVPKNCSFRPIYTGWFAGFSSLESAGGPKTTYDNDGKRFAGSTQDFTALYRLQSVLELFRDNSITVKNIHQHVQTIQKQFLQHLKQIESLDLSEKNLLIHNPQHHGHFLTFQLDTAEAAEKLNRFLLSNNIVTDVRGSRLRFGFGLYHDGAFDLHCLKKKN